MARRPMLDREEVFEAANQLTMEGKKVTALALRDALGGSLTTIYKYLAEWEANHPAARSAAASTEIPPGVQNALSAVWRSLSQEAAREIAEAKEQAAQEIKAAQEKFSEAVVSIADLETERDAANEQIEALNTQVTALQAELQKLSHELTTQTTAASELRNQVTSQQAELERLHAELAEERKSHQDEIKRLTGVHEAAQRQTTDEIKTLKSTLSDAQTKMQKLEMDKADAVGRLDQAAKQIKQLEESSLADRAERDSALKEFGQLQGLINGLNQQIASQKAQYDELIARFGKEEKPSSKGK